jgi:hypothetical protein
VIRTKIKAIGALYSLSRSVPQNCKKIIQRGISYPTETIINIRSDKPEVLKMKKMALELIGAL